MTEAFCVKCRRKETLKNTENVTLKNGRKAVKGTCSKCGTKAFRITGNKK